MCRRFVQKHSWPELTDLYALSDTPRTLHASYNIAPTATIDVVCLRNGQRNLIPMRWGLKTTGQSRALFTVRAETFANDPVFPPGLKLWPCIVPASGYYASCAINGAKQAFYFSAAAGGSLSIAGLADLSTDPANRGPHIASCTLIITPGNDVVTQARQHRMPAFLEPNDIASWLNGSAVPELLAPARNALLRIWRVSRRINEGATNDDASLIEPLTPLLL